MANKVLCLSGCGHVLFESVPAAENGKTMAVVEGPELDYDNERRTYFMECPACGTKNGFRLAPAGKGSALMMLLDRILD